MNDPHVVSLTYRIDKAETVDFDKAPPLRVDRRAFRVTVDAYAAKIEMADHFASVEEARNLVQPFLRAWSLRPTSTTAGIGSGSSVKRRRPLIEVAPQMAALLLASE